MVVSFSPQKIQFGRRATDQEYQQVRRVATGLEESPPVYRDACFVGDVKNPKKGWFRDFISLSVRRSQKGETGRTAVYRWFPCDMSSLEDKEKKDLLTGFLKKTLELRGVAAGPTEIHPTDEGLLTIFEVDVGKPK